MMSSGLRHSHRTAGALEALTPLEAPNNTQSDRFSSTSTSNNNSTSSSSATAFSAHILDARGIAAAVDDNSFKLVLPPRPSCFTLRSLGKRYLNLFLPLFERD